MAPPRARSWGRKGSTPVVRVRGRGSGLASMARLTCYKPGKRSRTFYSVREYRGRKGEPKGIGWRDLRDLLVRAHIQLGDPIVLVGDNLRMHLAEEMRRFIADHTDWLTVFQLGPGTGRGFYSGRASRGPGRRAPRPDASGSSWPTGWTTTAGRLGTAVMRRV
ncbi:hypothetical protein ACFY9F_36900 [Streptomyces sp. NPDC012421]|uniref:hypothetical protein n=1 Tax=Streptomyces sp. NPDC012421 TaxID=3364832 RepID=UPI0036E1DE83